MGMCVVNPFFFVSMSTVNCRLHVQQFKIPQYIALILHVDLNGCSVHFVELKRRESNTAIVSLYIQFRIYYVSGPYLGPQAVYTENKIFSSSPSLKFLDILSYNKPQIRPFHLTFRNDFPFCSLKSIATHNKNTTSQSTVSPDHTGSYLLGKGVPVHRG